MLIRNLIQMLKTKFFASGLKGNIRANQNSAESLLTEARDATAIAAEEFHYGKTANELLMENIGQEFSAIARWHFERSARKYNFAAARISEAIKLSEKDEQKLFLKTELQQITECAVRAEQFVKALTVKCQTPQTASLNKRTISSNTFDPGLNSREEILFA